MPREFTDAEAVAFNRYQAFGTPDEVQKIVQEVERLKTENAERRKANKDLEAERDALKAKVPEGAEVLTGDEAKAYAELKAKEMKLADVPKIVAERDTLQKGAAERDKRDALGKAVATEGWVPESVPLLHKLLAAAGDLPFEVREEDVEVTENGKTAKQKKPVGYVTANGQAVRLSKWAEAEELPASVFTATRTTAETGRTVSEQRGNGGAPKKDATAEDFAASTAKTARYDSF